MGLRQRLGYASSLLDGIVTRAGVRVFCYHGVVERKKDLRLERNFHVFSDFKAHASFLRSCQVLRLEELAEQLSNPPRKWRAAVIITFDDGFANNVLAAEVLDRFRLPWSLFVSTGAVGREGSIWTVELSLLVLHGRAESIEALDKTWALGSRADREAAFQGIRYPLKSMPAASRQEAMGRLRSQFPEGEVQRLLSEFPCMRMLTWEQVAELKSAGVEVGSHGVDHEIHHANQPQEVRRRELADSKAELERRLGWPCRFFAFPNGTYVNESVEELKEASYALAFTTQPGTVLSGADPYLLPRFEPSAVPAKFARSSY